MRYPPQKLVNTGTTVIVLYLFSLILALTAAALGAAQLIPDAVGMSLVGLVFALLYAAFVFKLIALYRMWKQIQALPARITAGLAVGLSCIPLFNIGWNFVAFYGLAVDLNRYASSRRIQAPRALEGSALAACILSILALATFCVPFVGSPVLLAAIILWYIAFWSMIKASVAIAESPVVPSPIPATPPTNPATFPAPWGSSSD